LGLDHFQVQAGHELSFDRFWVKEPKSVRREKPAVGNFDRIQSSLQESCPKSTGIGPDICMVNGAADWEIRPYSLDSTQEAGPLVAECFSPEGNSVDK
jgi:hypothetical protein